MSHIDAQGFRLNVGIIVLNTAGQVFWGRRIGMSAWQFPQGGVMPRESLREAMYRELNEETGLQPEHVEILGWTRRWLRYRLPKRYIRRHQEPLCIGQKQRWYVLALTASEENFDLNVAQEPEFEEWRWIDYWDSARLVVSFKRGVYKKALSELAPIVTRKVEIDLPVNPYV